jgi:hypothetical protein
LSGIFLYTLPIGPHIRATAAASLAGAALDLTVIGPSVAADRNPE